MNCVQCDEKVKEALLKVGEDYACSMACASEYEKWLRDSMQSEEILRRWVNNSYH